jgi:seryl-tRNA synthetase
LPPDAIKSIARIYTEHKTLCNTLNGKRNARSIIGERIRRSSDEKDDSTKQLALEEARKLKQEVSELEMRVAELEEQLLVLALAVPNDTHPHSPLGSESAAVTLSTHGPKPIPASPNRDHVNTGRKLGILDLESGSTVTGASWYFLSNEAALIELALTNYVLSVAIKNGFTPVITPDVVRADIANRCGFQPRDQSDPPVSQMYHISNSGTSSPSPELVLSGTAEIPLAGMFANKIFPITSLPLKVIGLGRAFRAEAGARGADTRGLYRVHQFTKLELFAVTAEEQSENMLETMRQVQVSILDGLGFPFRSAETLFCLPVNADRQADLPFRVLDMPTEELGASAYRKYDIEAWMPGRGSWGEISSTSNCTDYQARRLHIRYRSSPSETSETPLSYPSAGLPFAHTLNGTAAAIPRLVIALLENGVRLDPNGEVVGLNLPVTLKPFWLGGSPRDLVRWVPADELVQGQ